jgi:hypothetical protein
LINSDSAGNLAANFPEATGDQHALPLVYADLSELDEMMEEALSNALGRYFNGTYRYKEAERYELADRATAK